MLSHNLVKSSQDMEPEDEISVLESPPEGSDEYEFSIR